MGWAWSEIQDKSDDEIIREHDAMMASGMNVGVNYFVSEIYHRRQSCIARRIFCLTVVVTVLTFVNVLVAIALWKQQCNTLASARGFMDLASSMISG